MNFNFDETKAKSFLTTCSSVVSSMTELSKSLSSGWKFEEIRHDIKTLVSRTLGNVDVHFFGSRIIGLGTSDSDLDIFIDVGGKFNSTYTISGEFDSNYANLASALSLSANWRIKEKVLRTAVPIIITEYRPLRLSCKFWYQISPPTQTFMCFPRRHQPRQRFINSKLQDAWPSLLDAAGSCETSSRRQTMAESSRI